MLNQGHVFLNCSLTEAFCMALLEAARWVTKEKQTFFNCIYISTCEIYRTFVLRYSHGATSATTRPPPPPSCGLRVVSSNVGGVHEVLPADIMTLAPPAAPALAEALLQTLARGPAPVPELQHARMQSMYAWSDVAQRTAQVYHEAMAHPAAMELPGAAALRHGGLSLGWLLALVVLLARFFLSFGKASTGSPPTIRKGVGQTWREPPSTGGKGRVPLRDAPHCPLVAASSDVGLGELCVDGLHTLRATSFPYHPSVRA